ncbi:MAG TPA: TetR family transcriptional regulator [Microscillaceae bacterium]|nr:TetR family transcriptional regulator [Microscillaceae bacterium]
MKLKEKILLKAVALFNERGIANVSPNQIATALKISPGNLTYHYKTKAILMQTIYERMHQETLDYLDFDGYITLDDFRQSMLKFQEFQQKYSFFLDDMIFITRNYPKVAKMYEAANLKRLQQGRKLFDYFIATDRLLPETNGVNYDFLVLNVWMVGAFWTTQDKILTVPSPMTKPANMVEMTWHLLLPYLTEKGREEYFQISEFFKLEKRGEE